MLREPAGAFVAYLQMYSTTAHRFKHGRQSMLPMLAKSTCASKLVDKGSLRGKHASQEPSLSPFFSFTFRSSVRLCSDLGNPYLQKRHSGFPRAQASFFLGGPSP